MAEKLPEKSDKLALSSAEEHELSSVERLAQSFEISARRWELVVYPSLFAFIILAAYGFYLVYSLANDVSFIARSVDRNMRSMVVNIENVSHDMDQLTVAVERMSNNMAAIRGQIEVLDTMTNEMASMQRHVRHMTVGVQMMQGNVAHMNRSISRPMSFMSSFMPW